MKTASFYIFYGARFVLFKDHPQNVCGIRML